MDAIGWIIVIVIFLIFGKSLNITATTAFNQPNAVPTPNGIPNLIVNGLGTTQNQQDPPTAQPSPWAPVCKPPVRMPLAPYNPIAGVNNFHQSPVNIPAQQTKMTLTQAGRGY